MIALTADVSNSPSRSPTNVAASVAAAWETESEKTTPSSSQVRWKAGPGDQHAAIVLPPIAPTMNTTARPSVVGDDELRRVDDRAHRDEEDRDQQRRAEELDVLHDLALVRHQPVDGEAGEEGADDRLDADHRCDGRTGEQHGERRTCSGRRAPRPIVAK